MASNLRMIRLLPAGEAMGVTRVTSIGLFVATVVVTAAATGCGSSSSSTSSAPAKSAAAASAKPKAASGGAEKVQIKNFDYSPKRLVVAKGTKVSWTNEDSSNHTVTFDKSSKDLGNQRKGSTKSMRFTSAGTFTYHCDFHPFMKGTVVVK